MLENPPSLRAEGHAKRNDPVGRHTGNQLAIKGHAARLGLQESRDGVQRCGFSRAVCTDQGYDLPFIDLKGNTLNGMDGTIIHIQILYLKKALIFAHSSSSL